MTKHLIPSAETAREIKALLRKPLIRETKPYQMQGGDYFFRTMKITAEGDDDNEYFGITTKFDPVTKEWVDGEDDTIGVWSDIPLVIGEPYTVQGWGYDDGGEDGIFWYTVVCCLKGTRQHIDIESDCWDADTCTLTKTVKRVWFNGGVIESIEDGPDPCESSLSSSSSDGGGPGPGPGPGGPGPGPGSSDGGDGGGGSSSSMGFADLPWMELIDGPPSPI